MYDAESFRVIGACIEVHKALGPGLLESAYEECLDAEFEALGIPCVRQAPIDVRYRGRVTKAYFADFIVFEKIVLELKSVWRVHAMHERQLRTYTELAGLPIGLLINFNVMRIQKPAIRRVDRRKALRL